MDRVDELRAFAAAAQAGGFAEAGRRLGLSRSRISKLVIALEARLQLALNDADALAERAYAPWKDMEALMAEGGVERMSKKESLLFQRELDKLNRSLGGIKDMGGLPDALFVVDVGYHKIAITEANKLGIPVVGVVDTNHSPDGIAYVIPGNDDSGKAIRLYARGAADAVLEGRSSALQEVVKAASEEEFVEVEGEGDEA